MPNSPAPGQLWQHRNGNQYTILLLTNEKADVENREKYPVMIVYRGTNGYVWSRKLDDWHRSMTHLGFAPEVR